MRRNIWFPVVVSLLYSPFVGAEQSEQAIELAVDDPRPLAAAAIELEKRHGGVITYEDAPFLSPGDVVDVTSAVSKVLPVRLTASSHSTGWPTRDRVSRTGHCRQTQDEALSDAIAAHETSRYPGTFRVLRTNAALHVVPTGATDQSGRRIEYVSLLDTRISLPEGRRKGFDVMMEIASALSARAGTKVVLGTIPLNLLAHTDVDIKASDEMARGVLLRVGGNEGEVIVAATLQPRASILCGQRASGRAVQIAGRRRCGSRRQSVQRGEHLSISVATIGRGVCQALRRSRGSSRLRAGRGNGFGLEA